MCLWNILIRFHELYCFWFCRDWRFQNFFIWFIIIIIFVVVINELIRIRVLLAFRAWHEFFVLSVIIVEILYFLRFILIINFWFSKLFILSERLWFRPKIFWIQRWHYVFEKITRIIVEVLSSRVLLRKNNFW